MRGIKKKILKIKKENERNIGGEQNGFGLEGIGGVSKPLESILILSVISTVRSVIFLNKLI
jgi:hypothetical protein